MRVLTGPTNGPIEAEQRTASELDVLFVCAGGCVVPAPLQAAKHTPMATSMISRMLVYLSGKYVRTTE
jgi:hypothetical protein